MIVNIEVVLHKEATTTEKGKVLERFARRLLETQNYTVVEELRLTASEVDLLAQDNATSERVMVECKAYRSTISAEVLMKLLGNVTFNDSLNAGWLISTYALGKDAKGFRDQWNQKPLSDRRRLQIYDPEALTARLIAAKVVVSPDTLQVPSGIRVAEEKYLLLTAFGEFWAAVVLDHESGIRQSALLFDALTAARVTSTVTIAKLKETDSTLAQLAWLAEAPSLAETEAIKQELQSIVEVPIADHWADYRPARPQDFVGRDQLLTNVFDFLECVRQKTTKTRILAIKAPSGWGKSSFVLKVANTARNIRNRRKCFVYAVDSRAATTKRFGELALATAIQAALKAQFIQPVGSLGFGSTTNPFGDPSLRDVLQQLQAGGKVLCLIFDQFEELLYKSELESVFDEIRALCNSVDEAQENVVIGFSWKTDGTIPTEHKAYHLWHNLADRRREVELAPFSAAEVSNAMTRFSRELGEAVTPQLKRLLQDHCQGYPWLLKKLCIHIMDLVRGGLDQNDILVRSLSIQELFAKDIERLASDEYACIKEIAANAPAEFFRIVETYGNEIVNRLLDKRLIIRSGPRLSIYWDIFRDYLLTERVPYIPINYVPQTTFNTFVHGMQFLLQEHTASYDDFATELGIAKPTAENVIRDLVMVGHAEANRRTETVSLEAVDEESAARLLLSFCVSHVVYQELLKDKGDGSVIAEEDILVVSRRVLRLPSGSEVLFAEYGKRLLRWFSSVGVITTQDRVLRLQARIPFTRLLQNTQESRRRRESVFLGAAPPQKVLEALEDARTRSRDRAAQEDAYGRNAIATLVGLGLIKSSGIWKHSGESFKDANEELRASLGKQPTVRFVLALLESAPKLRTGIIGQRVAEEFGFSWSPASCARYGSALNVWARWMLQKA